MNPITAHKKFLPLVCEEDESDTEDNFSDDFSRNSKCRVMTKSNDVYFQADRFCTKQNRKLLTNVSDDVIANDNKSVDVSNTEEINNSATPKHCLEVIDLIEDDDEVLQPQNITANTAIELVESDDEGIKLTKAIRIKEPSVIISLLEEGDDNEGNDGDDNKVNFANFSYYIVFHYSVKVVVAMVVSTSQASENDHTSESKQTSAVTTYVVDNSLELFLEKVTFLSGSTDHCIDMEIQNDPVLNNSYESYIEDEVSKDIDFQP